MKIQKGDFVCVRFNWTKRLKLDKSYRVIDIYPIFIMSMNAPSLIENYLIIEDEQHIKTGYSEGKFVLSSDNLKLKRLDKLKNLNK